ncbi:MAG: hydrogenase [Pseudomonadota bacterium]
MKEAPPVVAKLASAPAAGWVDAGTLDDFLSVPGDAVLFIWSDPVRFPESLDVAVVLPELRAKFSDVTPRFRIGVVTAAAEDAIARRYGATRRPSLVFVREGSYVATIAGMHDWDDFVREVGLALEAPVSRAPRVPIVIAAHGTAPNCH